jgi:hypothetical protein
VPILARGARRLISRPRISPTWSSATSASKRWTPGRPSADCPLMPRSSSMMTTCSAGPPRATARSTRAYWRAVDSRFSATCWGEDWRTATMALRCLCQGWSLPERRGVNQGLPPRGAWPRAVAPAAVRGARGVVAADPPAGVAGSASLARSSVASGAGGRGGAFGVGHEDSPGVKRPRCCRHHAASSSNAATLIVIRDDDA